MPQLPNIIDFIIFILRKPKGKRNQTGTPYSEGSGTEQHLRINFFFLCFFGGNGIAIRRSDRACLLVGLSCLWANQLHNQNTTHTTNTYTSTNICLYIFIMMYDWYEGIQRAPARAGEASGVVYEMIWLVGRSHSSRGVEGVLESEFLRTTVYCSLRCKCTNLLTDNGGIPSDLLLCCLACLPAYWCIREYFMILPNCSNPR
ncbi:hypothetical protein F5B22DRAFT_170169 [Xylaria bambusicola]|uniref:uncharacterized protein n=1 Tax=Xylaria bambusicola TaxID=326684 RepID=UPI002008EB11|nr:uncharacterized protein F5B22DRAFT_170169 [Xylaria bambusicola]KAI0526658.1 hypothetical protein F5B22DRAFT_170169 [Xylaria bambusicola]